MVAFKNKLWQETQKRLKVWREQEEEQAKG